MATAAFIAANRFGLGPRPGELERLALDAESQLLGQLERQASSPELDGLPSGSIFAKTVFELRRVATDQKARRTNENAFQNLDPAARQGKDTLSNIRQELHGAYINEVVARTAAAVEGDTPFLERLVRFWSNHFTVSVRRPIVAGLAGAFEREAIRPYVTARFTEMLNAATSHPAMLLYLDNARSSGPNSRFGRRSDRHGINENLARELLELHTVGVDSGYTQSDVEALARVLTGWTIGRPGRGEPGAFRFEPAMHEPGAKRVMELDIPEGGEDEGRTVLTMLARHPATARHIATKLARHFIADDPPPAAVERLARAFLDHDGDLKIMSTALVESPEAWAEPLPKIKTPEELILATLRASGTRMFEPKPLLGSFVMLNQAPFSAPSPAGWPDRAADWLGPDQLMQRLFWIQATAHRLAPVTDPREVLEQSIGPVATRETRFAIERAPDRAGALTLLFASAEFQRR